jgi:chromosomal replication initiator protein
MSASQGCTDNMDVVQNFTEALAGRIGVDRYRMWFGQNVTFRFEPDSDRTGKTTSKANTEVGRGTLLVLVRGQFALDRLEKNFLSQLRGAAMQVFGSTARVELRLDQPVVTQTELPLDGCDAVHSVTSGSVTHGIENSDAGGTAVATPATRHHRRPSGSKRRGKTHSISSLVSGTAGRSEQANHRRQQNTIGSRPAPRRPLPGQMPLPGIDASNPRHDASNAGLNGKADAKKKPSDAMTLQTFVASSSNKLAFTAATMVTETPGVASPLFLCGPTGSGKTHLMSSIADMLRRRHRMRRVVHEQFTNDFIASVSSSGITSFRSRYRDIDALLIDDIQFLASKKATLRELLYTLETLSSAGRPMVFSGLHAPTEIQGLTSELAGRMAAGLVCQMGALDATARQVIMQRLIKQRCPVAIGDDLVQQLSSIVAGDGRVISGLVNSVTLLARMHGRAPTMDEVRTLSGDLLRSARPVATLTVIETAVCEAFQLPQETLRSKSQSRSTTEPRMLAMYLARQITSSAYAEIARHFGGRSHSTAIAAEKNVTNWLGKGKEIGRGHAAMSTREALDRVENLIRSRVG